MSTAIETEKTYNGWTNYETWAVKLWIDNEQASQDYWRSAARYCRSTATDPNGEHSEVWTAEEEARYTLADRLKQEMNDAAPDLGASLWTDLLRAALSEVNWTEIAQKILEDLPE